MPVYIHRKREKTFKKWKSHHLPNLKVKRHKNKQKLTVATTWRQIYYLFIQRRPMSYSKENKNKQSSKQAIKHQQNITQSIIKKTEKSNGI